MRILLSILFICFLTINFSTSYTKETKLKKLEPFTSLCISDIAGGFNWKNGNWKLVQFPESKKIIKKLNDKESKCFHLETIGSLEVEKYLDTSFKSGQTHYATNGCYMVNNFGSDFEYQYLCTEIYRDNGFGTLEIDLIRCVGQDKKVAFVPTGRYQFSFLHDHIEGDKNNHNDSLILEVGKCSVM